jgi:hypothetical protein
MDASNASTTNGVFLPNFPLATGDLLRAIEHSGSVEQASSDDAGEYYAMAMASVKPAEEVMESAIIVIPLTSPHAGEALDLTFVAASDCMFFQLHQVPQPRCTYGHCAAYSAGAPFRPVEVGAVFKFPSISNYVVAKPALAASVRAIRGTGTDLPLQQTQDKRQCVRQPEELGELADEAGSRPKGMSNYLLDLDGKKLYTRNKTDIAQREEDLGFLFRAMDKPKMDYSVSTDLVLQVEVYRSMLCEQGDTRADDRHAAFISCGLISRIHRLQFFTKNEKLKLFLVGSVLKQGTATSTLSLEDFVTGEKIASKPTTCPNNNSGLVSALKNLQTMMQIVFSDAYGKCFDVFIEKLEGAMRPMELVPSDLLKHSVELTLRKVFRIIRSVKSTALPDLNIQGPELCSKFFTDAFAKLSDDLSDHGIMTRQNMYYRVMTARTNDHEVAHRAEAPAPPRTEKPTQKPTVKFVEPKSEEKAGGASKVCSGHLGKQLAAVRKDGRPYACGYGKDCTFSHISIVGKSDQKLLEIAAGMPPPMKSDITRAVNLRK